MSGAFAPFDENYFCAMCFTPRVKLWKRSQLMYVNLRCMTCLRKKFGAIEETDIIAPKTTQEYMPAIRVSNQKLYAFYGKDSKDERYKSDYAKWKRLPTEID